MVLGPVFCPIIENCWQHKFDFLQNMSFAFFLTKIVKQHPSSQCLISRDQTFSTPTVIQGHKLQQKAAFFTLTELKVQKIGQYFFLCMPMGINGVRILKIWRRYKSSFLDMIKCAIQLDLSSEEQLLFTSCFPVVLTLKYGNEQKIKCIFFILFIHLNIQ